MVLEKLVTVVKLEYESRCLHHINRFNGLGGNPASLVEAAVAILRAWTGKTI